MLMPWPTPTSRLQDLGFPCVASVLGDTGVSQQWGLLMPRFGGRSRLPLLVFRIYALNFKSIC